MKISKKLKLKISILIIFIFLASSVIIGLFKIIPKSKAEIVAATSFAGGNGTVADPYQISNASELLFLANQVNKRANIYNGKYIELTSDIDLSDISNWTPIGCLSSSNGYRNADTTGFRGTFNGNNYTIKNINISVSTANLKNSNYAIGLFGAIHGGTIKNLKLDNVNIEIADGFTSTLANDMAIGGLVGKVIQKSNVYNVEVNNFTFNDYSRIINLNEKFYSVGGISGDIITNDTVTPDSSANKLDNCIVKNTNIITNAVATNTTKAKQYFVGGITGRIRYQSIYPTNCVFSGTLLGNAYISPSFAGNIVPVTANHADFAGISCSSVADSSITNLLYYNATIKQGDGSAPSQIYNKRSNPIGIDCTGFMVKNYVDNLNAISESNSNFYNWKSVSGKVALDYGHTSSSVYITNITDTTVTLLGKINNYNGQEISYEWKNGEERITKNSNEIMVTLKPYSQNITLKIITDTGNYTDSIELPKGDPISAEIQANRIGIEYQLMATLLGANYDSSNYTIKWQENDNIIEGNNTTAYTTKAGAEPKNIKVIITDLLNNYEYEQIYTIPSISLYIDSEDTSELNKKVNAVFKIEEEIITDINETEFTYNWNIDGKTVTTTNPITYVDLNTQIQQVSLNVINSELNLQSSNTLEILPVNLFIKFNKNIENSTVIATLEGTDISKIDISKISYQWYYVANDEESLINGATTNILENYLIDSTYKVVVTYKNNNDIIIEDYINLSKNVIFVDYNKGINTNNGAIPEEPVKTLDRAYQILNSINGIQTTTEKDNIVVIMGTYSDKTNTYGNGTDIVFTVPATITGKYNEIDYSGILYFWGGDANVEQIKALQANTKFEYLKFSGNSSTTTGSVYMYAQGYNLTMGKGISMINYTLDISTSHGLSSNTKCTNFHVLGGHCNYNKTSIEKGTEEPCIITIESGSYARIIAGGRNTVTNGISKNVYGTKETPFNAIININYEGEEHSIPQDLDSSGRRFVDIGLVCGGQTDGAGYFNTTINYNNGTVGRFVGGSLGNNREIIVNNVRYDTNYFIGNLELNINGGYIHEFYGGSLGRYTGNITHNGNININIFGGTINNNLFSAGASAITGKRENKAIVNLNMYGGTINGNIYGGAYGYSSDITTEQASTESGILYGDIFINISGGTTNGNVFGGGKGTDLYASDSKKQALARVIGNIKILIGDKAKINGSIYGAGDGYTQFEDMAEVTGNTEIYVENQSDLLSNTNSSIVTNNIHGAGNVARLIGNTTVNIKNARIAGNIYGGGEAANITGNVQINLNTGTHILQSIYGGGENGVVGESENTTTVEINVNGKSVIEGDLYGGGENAITYSSVTMSIKNLIISGSVHGGGKLGLIEENINVDIEQIDITGNIYGGGEEANVNGNITTSVISGMIKGDIYGGGNLGQVLGNTKLLIGDESSEESITVEGVTYAGGKGADSTTITVIGNSQATIAGINTNIASYGSVELGAVQGEVNIVFNNYKNRNSTNRYKNMSGINKATNLHIINSYVYLTGGLQNISNVYLPKGSGISIAEDSQIDGNFTGGGVLYLKSEACFTIMGDIKQNSTTTTLTLNPEKLVDTYIIKGNENYPYVVVKGTDYLQNTSETAFISGYAAKYSILNKTNSENNSIYYIERDVEINTYIDVQTILEEGKKYSNLTTITGENSNNYGDIKITKENMFTVSGTIQYTHVGIINELINGTKFKNVTREFSIQENYADVIIPKGTRITLINEQGTYGYLAEEDISKIPVSDFKSIETKTNISEANDISSKFVIYQGNTFRYEENFKIIFDFSDCEYGMNPGIYNFGLYILDGEVENFSSNNTVTIKNNTYNLNYDFQKDICLSKSNVKLNATFNVEELDNIQRSSNQSDILAVITLENQENKKMQIPKGAIIKIDNNEINTNSEYAIFKVIENINNLTSKDFTIDIDMQNCLNYLEEGRYYINLDFYLANGKTINSSRVYNKKCGFNIITGQDFGINAEIINTDKNDKAQLIDQVNQTKSIKINVEKGNLIGTNVKVVLQKRTAPFTYENISNTVVQDNIADALSTQNITADFENKLDNGMYRLVFELYDQNNYKYCEDTINIFVQR